MSFVKSLIVKYLQKLVQLCRNLDKGKNDQSQYIQYKLGRHDIIGKNDQSQYIQYRLGRHDIILS